MFGDVGLRKCCWTPKYVFEIVFTSLNNVCSFSGCI